MQLTLRVTGGTEADRLEFLHVVERLVAEKYELKERLHSGLKDPATEEYLYLDFRRKE